MQTPISGISYGLKYQARCVAAQAADARSTRWLVGTLSLREENEVHLIQLGDTSPDIVCRGLYTHEHEIWDLAACPFDASLFSTVYASDGETGTTVWKIPDGPGGGKLVTVPLQNISSLPGQTQRLKCSLWCPSGQNHQLVTVGTDSLLLWDLDFPTKTSQASIRELSHMAAGSWDPHDVDNVATATDTSIQCWDLRTMRPTIRIEQAHSLQPRDIDFNPKKQNIIITAGDDSQIRIWDLKMPNIPLQEMPGHHHWTMRVQYNPKYEDLVLSSGTDAVVNLWRVASDTKGKSVSGSPIGHVDALLRSYTEQEDSVYGIAWSTRDPWVFASVCYDGRVMVESVPVSIRKQLLSERK